MKLEHEYKTSITSPSTNYMYMVGFVFFQFLTQYVIDFVEIEYKYRNIMYKYKHASACQSHAPQCRILNSRYSKRGAPRLGPARTNGTASRGPCSSTSKAGLP